MATKKSKKDVVHPMDAEAAISDILDIMKENGMTDRWLAAELGWTHKKVDSFLYGVGNTYRDDLIKVSVLLVYEVDFTCTDGEWEQ